MVDHPHGTHTLWNWRLLMAETVDFSHIMLTQLAWIAKTGRRLRRNWQLLEKFNGLMAIYLVLPPHHQLMSDYCSAVCPCEL
jgi:hypothetical protein